MCERPKVAERVDSGVS